MSMPKRIAVSGMVLIAACAGVGAGDLNPPGPPAPTMSTLQQVNNKLDQLAAQTWSFQFGGVTTATTDGSHGWWSMNQLCTNEFGPNARMCTSKEVMSTPVSQWPSLAAYNGAWVHPYFAPTGGYTDVSGMAVSSGGNFSCNGWGTTGTTGMWLVGGGGTYNGAFAVSNCTMVIHVACCLPPSQ